MVGRSIPGPWEVEGGLSFEFIADLATEIMMRDFLRYLLATTTVDSYLKSKKGNTRITESSES